MNQTQEVHTIVQTDDLVEDVCWRLVAQSSVGRIGFVANGEVHVLPVNFALLGHTIVFRTALGSMLSDLEFATPVVVEVDHVDEAHHTGWSVVIRGVVEKVNPDLLPLIGNTVHPWADGAKDCWLWVRSTTITGRGISRPATGTGFRLPYMSPD